MLFDILVEIQYKFAGVIDSLKVGGRLGEARLP